MDQPRHVSRSVAALALLLALAPTGAGAGGAPPAGRVAPAPHDLHVTYGNAAVEGSTLVVRLRFFADDLETALGRMAGRELHMAPDPAVDSLFLAYLADRFQVSVAGGRLEPTLLARGQDELDREPVWWYTIQFQAPTALEAFRLKNTLLLELFRDQRNIVKVVRFPDQKQLTFSFAAGEESVDVKF